MISELCGDNLIFLSEHRLMKWIDTQELVSLLKRFPNEPIEASAYLDRSVASVHNWKYSSSQDNFLCQVGSSSISCSEVELLRLYKRHFWKITRFFSLRDAPERKLAVRMVEELIMLGHLDDIITDYEIDNVRVCEHCHHLMNEGWIVNDARTFCSDECLLSACPEYNDGNLQEMAGGDSLYWTAWED